MKKPILRIEALALVLVLSMGLLLSVKQFEEPKQYEYVTIFRNQGFGSKFGMATFNEEINTEMTKEKYVNMEKPFAIMGERGWLFVDEVKQLDGSIGLLFMRGKR
uniref:hypothetical protein n=1 Tax=Roseivirga sp. TaxID=1964215 RepID=UPI004047CBC1